MALFLIGVSALFQLAAAFQALSLIRLTRRHWAWVLIASAVGMMAARRVYVFFFIMAGGAHPESNLASDLIALATSMLMLAGVAAIGTIFRELFTTSERLKAGEARYREISNRLHTIFVRAPVGIYQSTRGGGLITANPTLARIYGYASAEELVASIHDVAEQLYVDPEERQRLLAILDAEGKVEDFQCRMRRKDGRVIWTSRNMTCVRDEQGRVIHFDAFLTDITTRKEAEALREHVERVVRHDLKAPLQGIIGIPGVIRQEKNLSDQQTSLLSMIEDSGYQMLDMIDNSLNVYKMEQGTYSLDAKPVNLVAVAKRVLAGGEAFVRGRGGTLVLAVDGQPAGEDATFVVVGEESLLRTMLANLVNNAMEASPKGGEVRVLLSREGDLAKVRVENLGVVPREIRDNFFGKYVTAGKLKGTGLGTYSASLITSVHGGSIAYATSDEENRTWVEATLPVGGPESRGE